MCNHEARKGLGGFFFPLKKQTNKQNLHKSFIEIVYRLSKHSDLKELLNRPGTFHKAPCLFIPNYVSPQIPKLLHKLE